MWLTERDIWRSMEWYTKDELIQCSWWNDNEIEGMIFKWRLNWKTFFWRAVQQADGIQSRPCSLLVWCTSGSIKWVLLLLSGGRVFETFSIQDSKEWIATFEATKWINTAIGSWRKYLMTIIWYSLEHFLFKVETAIRNFSCGFTWR